MLDCRNEHRLCSSSIYLPVFALVGIGILMVYSSSSIVSIHKFGDSFHYVRNHLLTVIISLGGMLFFSRINYLRYRNSFVVTLIIIFSLVLLCLVFIPSLGVSAGGARRWIRVWPSTFQPSEFAKIALTLFLALYISRNASRMDTIIYGIIIPFGVMGIFQAILLLQPDFGSAMNLAIITITLLFLGGVKGTHLLGAFVPFIPVIVMLIIKTPYRLARLLAFLDPGADPLGKGYQLIQSFIAFGNGGLLGLGPGGSMQKLHFLPESHTDFIFSIIGEEFGFVGAFVVILLFIWFIFKGINIATSKQDFFGYYLALGLTVMIGVQALINFCVTTGLLPTKGLPLPFVSYGGSALVINMAAVGILINISHTTDSPVNEGDKKVNSLANIKKMKSKRKQFLSDDKKVAGSGRIYS
jgi:cell division protein FtsW